MSKSPLRLHATGQWCKKHAGRTYYFGTDQNAALRRYLAEWPDILAGRAPAATPDDEHGPTVEYLLNHFLAAKRAAVSRGDLSARTWAEYHGTGEAMIKAFGRERPVKAIRPDDFAGLLDSAAKRLGPVSLGNFVQRVRTICRYGFEAELIAVPLRFGPGFAKPSRRAIRIVNADRKPRLLAAAHIRKLIDGARNPQLRAMIFLGINCGFGATDCSELPRSAIQGAWLDFRRPKTGMARRCPLWPETVAALRACKSAGPLVFLTKYGKPWVRFGESAKGKPTSRNDSIGQEFRKLAASLKVPIPGGFYVLRHTHRTVADAALDPVAAGLIMGHVDASMAAVYRERIDDARLVRVSDSVRKWLYGDGEK